MGDEMQHNRAFRIFSGCIIVSFVGNVAYLIAATWLILQMTGRSWAVPALFLISAVPGVLFAPMVAQVVSRANLRRLLILVDVCSGVVVLLGPLADLLGLLSAAQLYVQEFVIAFGGSLFFTASRSFVREIVPPERLLSANSVTIGVFQVGNTLGALVGGVVVQQTSPAVAMTFNAATFFMSAAGIWAVRTRGCPPSKVAAKEDHQRHQLALWRGFVETGGRLLQSQKLRVFFVCFLAIAGLQRFLLGLLQPFVANDLDGGPVALGIIQAAMALGALLGGVLVPRLERQWGRRTALVALVVPTVPFVCLLGVSGTLAAAAAIYLGLGVLTQVLAIAQTSIQEDETVATDAERLALLGMMQSVAIVCVFGATTVVTALLGTRLAYVVFGLVFGLVLAHPLYCLLSRRGTGQRTYPTSRDTRGHDYRTQSAPRVPTPSKYR